MNSFIQMKSPSHQSEAYSPPAAVEYGRTCLFTFLLLTLAVISSLAQPTFTPGGDWYDVNGNKVHAVEGGIMKVGNLYYLWGMDRSQNNYTFRGVNMYSSPDLKTWTFVNTILSNASHPDIASGSVVERPKLLHNTSTGQFVLWVHYEGWNAYATSEVGYATSSTIGGNYTWQGHYRPLGLDSKDMNVYKDTDGKAYMISSISNNSQVVIMELNSSYTGHVREVYRGSGANTSSGFGCEGHALFKSGSTYYLIESLCSGWDTNDNRYYTATSLAGPWTSRGNIAASGAKTYQSQVTYAFPVSGSNTTTYCFVGDRWSTGNYSMTSLIVLPIQVSGTTLSLPWYDQWSINTSTGSWSGSAINYSGEFRIVNRGSGKVMEVASSSTANHAPIQQNTWNGNANQRWTITNLGRGEYQITNVNSGKALDNPSGSRTAGTNTIQYDYVGGYNQKWHIIQNANGSYRIDNVNSLGKTLEIANNSNSNGAGVVIGNNFSYTGHQTWDLVPAGGSTPTYYQIQNRATGLLLDGMGRTANGDACGQYGNTSHVNSHWEMISTGSYYYFQNRGTGLRLDGMGRTSNGTDAGQWSNTTSNNAQWSVQQYSGNYYRIQNRATGLYLDGMGRTDNGSNVGQWANTTSNNAQWQLVAVSSSSGARMNTGLDQTELSANEEEISVINGYPNPFKDRAHILVSLQQSAEVNIELFSASGINIQKYAFGKLPAGRHELEMNGEHLQAGVYVYKIFINGKWRTGKLMKTD